MASILHRSRHDDHELARRVGAGDGTAFAMLDARHRSALISYANRLLRRSEHDAEDVVQDVLIRVHDALRAGDAPDELRPWLYRLTRNRAIDEVRRKRWGDEALDGDTTFAGDQRQDPATMLGRKEAMRRLVEDLAGLPPRQRTALLARELDDQSVEQIAAQLGVSVLAAHKLAARARENLIKTRDARDAACPDVRAALLDAYERGVRTTEHGLRHVKGCDCCRAYQRDIRRLSKQLHALNPALGLPLLAGLAKLAGGGGAKAAAGAAAVVAVAATGGIVVLRTDIHSPGEPAPFRLFGARDSKGRPVTRGTPIPEGRTIVTARVRVPASARPRTIAAHPTLMLPCPAGMKYAGLQAPGSIPIALNTKNTILGSTPGAHLVLNHRGIARSTVFTVGIECRRPGPYGSIFPVARSFERALQRGERRLGRICAPSNAVSVREPLRGRGFSFVIAHGSPVAVLRRDRSGRYTRVHIPSGDEGWIRTRGLCP